MGVWNEVLISTIVQNDRCDADYFQQRYIELDKFVNKGLPISEISETVDLQSNGAFKRIFDILRDSEEKVIPYIRSGNVGTFFLDKDELHMISKKAHYSLPKTHTKLDDILMARKGKIGGATIITEDEVDFNSNDNVVNIRLRDPRFIPEYFVTFWNSKYGQEQIQRLATGNVQPWLSMKQVRMLKTVLIDRIHQEEIQKNILQAARKSKLSKSLYNQSEKLLEKELGIDKLQIIKNKTSESSFSEIVEVGRTDADYYQTHFRSIADHIKTIQTQPLSQIANLLKGIEVGSSSYTVSGKLFIRVSNIKKSAIATGNSDKYIAESLFNNLKTYQPFIGDVLLTKDGTLGECYIVDQEIEGIISGGIMKLSLKNSTIPAEYLGLVINSKICKLQIERVCSGALILHWKPRDIATLRIPILDHDVMARLADLVISSKHAKKESEILLEKAKKRIEDIIEGEDLIMLLSIEDKELLKELCLQHQVSYEKVVRLLDTVQDYEFKDRRTGIYDALRDVLWGAPIKEVEIV